MIGDNFQLFRLNRKIEDEKKIIIITGLIYISCFKV